MRSLVLARVGPSSLHRAWVRPGGERPWDLVLLPYTDIGPQDGVDCEVADVIPGPKWEGIRRLLETWDGWRDYDQVWLPDDDLAADQDTITRMFEVAAGAGLDLWQPALHESSYFAHFDTMRNRRLFGRRGSWVEIMACGFSRHGLATLAPTLAESETGWGWGLDSVWGKVLDYKNMGVIDGTPVVHTRPVGVLRDPDLARRVHAESDHLLSRYGCRQDHTTFGAFGEDLKDLELAPEELLRELVLGWDYLVEHDPRILAWIAHFQGERFGAPPYPTEGTPTSASAAEPAIAPAPA